MTTQAVPLDPVSTPRPPRIDLDDLAPEISRAMARLDAAAARGLERTLMDLVRARASQINGCAYCIDMHTKDARIAGETEQRLYALPAWREAPYFSEREQAALALTEAVTELTSGPVSDEVFDEAARHFTDPELAQLIGIIVAVNAWNRIGVTTRAWTPGSYQP
jgi:AhpD family alkylhydroperoxidase